MFGNKKKQITLEEITSDRIKDIRNTFSIPDYIIDQEIISVLMNDLIRNNFNKAQWNKYEIQTLLNF